MTRKNQNGIPTHAQREHSNLENELNGAKVQIRVGVLRHDIWASDAGGWQIGV
jgi:hypothetical protein